MINLDEDVIVFKVFVPCTVRIEAKRLEEEEGM